jgi:hypothetical protein
MLKKPPGQPNADEQEYKGQTRKLTIDCATPVEDRVLDPASLEKFL